MAFWAAYREAYEADVDFEPDAQIEEELYEFHKKRRVQTGGDILPMTMQLVTQYLPQPIAEEVVPEMTEEVTEQQIRLMMLMCNASFHATSMADLRVAVELNGREHVDRTFLLLLRELVRMRVSSVEQYRTALSYWENVGTEVEQYVPMTLRIMIDFDTIRLLQFLPAQRLIRLGHTSQETWVEVYEVIVELHYRNRSLAHMNTDTPVRTLHESFLGIVNDLVGDLPLFETFVIRVQTTLMLGVADIIDVVIGGNRVPSPDNALLQVRPMSARFLKAEALELAHKALYSDTVTGMENFPYAARLGIADFCWLVLYNYDMTHSINDIDPRMENWLLEQQYMNPNAYPWSLVQGKLSQMMARRRQYFRNSRQKYYMALLAQDRRAAIQRGMTGVELQNYTQQRRQLYTQQLAAEVRHIPQ